MTTTLAVPESLRSYFTDRAVHSVVDHMLASKASDVPLDLDWSEIRDFHMAHASAAKVRADRASLLLDLWDAVWKAPLQAHGITQDVPFEEYPDYTVPSPKVFWEDSLYRIFYFPNVSTNFLYTCVWASVKGEIILSMAYETDAGNMTDLTLPAPWELDEFEYYNMQDKSVTIQKDTTHLDIIPLQQAAQEAVAVLVQSVTG